MSQIIKTRNGIITFEERAPISGSKTLVIEVATKNLLDVKKILDANDVKFGLIYGTLLGAIRENAFIKHDEDIDLFMLDEHKEDLLAILQDLINCGFQVIRYDKKLLSISRDNEYIDFYFFRKKNFLYRKCEVGLTAKAKYLENTMDYPFLGEIFQVPQKVEYFLEELYGKTWKIPIKNDPSMNHNKYIIFRNSIKRKAPLLFKILSGIKKNLKS